MHALPGFNLACAQAAMHAMQTDDPTFIERSKHIEFYGLYDPHPCGFVVFEGNVIHVASTRPAGLVIRRLVRDALKTRDILFAPIHAENEHTAHLAELLGFRVGLSANGINLYWRTK